MPILIPGGFTSDNGKFQPLESGDSIYGSTTRWVTQASHGFSVLTGLRYNGSSWVTAVASAETTLADGVVVAVLDTNNFIIAESGYFNIPAHGKTPVGDWFFLSAASAGVLTATAPDEFVQPLIRVLDADTVRVYPSSGFLAATGGASSSSQGGNKFNQVLTTVATNITASSLDIDTDITYIIQGDIVSNANSNRITVYINGDVAETDYSKVQIFQSAATTVAASVTSASGAAINGLLSTGNFANFYGTIRKTFDGTNTRFTMMLQSFISTDRVAQSTIYRTFSGNVNLTSLRLQSDQTNGLGIGTRFRVLSTGSGGEEAPYWVNVTGTSQAAIMGKGYITNNASLVTVTLPAGASQGDVMEVCGRGAGGWLLAQNASQTIHFGAVSTTAGVTGSLASTNRHDTLKIICVADNTDFVVLNSQGNLTVT